MPKETKYGIWWTATGQKNFEPGWVLDEAYRVALYANDKQANTDRRFFVHPDEYEVRKYTGRS